MELLNCLSQVLVLFILLISKCNQPYTIQGTSQIRSSIAICQRWISLLKKTCLVTQRLFYLLPVTQNSIHSSQMASYNRCSAKLQRSQHSCSWTRTEHVDIRNAHLCYHIQKLSIKKRYTFWPTPHPACIDIMHSLSRQHSGMTSSMTAFLCSVQHYLYTKTRLNLTQRIHNMCFKTLHTSNTTSVGHAQIKRDTFYTWQRLRQYVRTLSSSPSSSSPPFGKPLPTDSHVWRLLCLDWSCANRHANCVVRGRV